VLGLTYIVQFKEIKKKHLGFFYTRLPSLQTLDVMNARGITIGWLFLTIGLVSGAVWASQARAVAPDDPNLQAMSLVDPKILFAMFAWAVYSFAVLARRTLGWSGRRTARLSVFGFVIVLLNFLPINYFLTTSHTF
jgi:ABC-type transport system involved in cytochrome c biogenesis permease subunit